MYQAAKRRLLSLSYSMGELLANLQCPSPYCALLQVGLGNGVGVGTILRLGVQAAYVGYVVALTFHSEEPVT